MGNFNAWKVKDTGKKKDWKKTMSIDCASTKNPRQEDKEIPGWTVHALIDVQRAGPGIPLMPLFIIDPSSGNANLLSFDKPSIWDSIRKGTFYQTSGWLIQGKDEGKSHGK